MNCQKASSLLSAYIDRELAQEERRQLRLHLLHCSDCAEELQDLKAVKGGLGSFCVVDAPNVLSWLRLNYNKSEEGVTAAPPTLIWQHSWFRRTCTVAALLLLFGVGSWLLLPQQRTQNQNVPAPIKNIYSIPQSSLAGMHFIP